MNIGTGPVVILGDLHAPYYDEAAFSVALQVIKAARPQAVVLNGDMLDCYQLSNFDKDPKRVGELQSDLNNCRYALEQIRGAAWGAHIYYTEGNHEKRLTTWKWKNPAIASLKNLTVPGLLDLKGLDIEWVPDTQRLTFGDWLLLHGNKIGPKAGYTAQKMIERYGSNGVSNHVHRLAQVCRRFWLREHTWIENGCLCKLDVEYGDLFDWQHGITVLHYADPETWTELVQIKNGRARYNGTIYSS